MKETGELVEWNDDRGFGFVQPAAGARLFIHISAFERPLRRPEIGDRLAFTRGPGKDGRPAVALAQIAGATRRPRSGPSEERIEGAQRGRAFRLVAAAAVLAAIVLLPLPRITIWIYLVMGAISFASYWLDKRAAEAGRWRISEATLHGLDAGCGILGGLLAQAALHHKTAKPAFAFVTFGLVLCHLVALLALAFWQMDLPTA